MLKKCTKHSHVEDAVSRTQEIADTVDIDLELGKRYFPSFKPDQRIAHSICGFVEQGLRNAMKAILKWLAQRSWQRLRKSGLIKLRH